MLGIKQLDAAEYAISANAVLGIRDSGKTYTATKAAEELYDASIPFIALDPIGVWGSLRVPGKGKGYPVVVAGGRRSDLPLTVKVPAKNSQHPDRRAVLAKGAKRRAPVPATAFVEQMKAKLEPPKVAAKPPTPASSASVLRQKADTGALERAENKGWREGQESVRAQIPKLLDAQHAVSFQMGVEWCRGAAVLAARAIPNAELVPSRRSSQEIRTLTSQHAPPTPASPARTPPRPASNHRQAPSKGASPPSNGALAGPQATLLRALAWWKEMGHPAPTRAQAAAVAGWRVTAGHLKNVSGHLRSAGLIEYPERGRFALTEEGLNAAPEPAMGATLLDGLRATLTGPQKTVLDALLKHRRQSRQDLCDEIGWDASAGHVKNILGNLRSMQIIDYQAKGEVELQKWVQ